MPTNFDYLADQGAFEAAEKLRMRAQQFLTDQLCPRPERRHIPQRDIWEVWIPDAKLVVWYRFTDDELEIVRFWHTSQDRQL